MHKVSSWFHTLLIVLLLSSLAASVTAQSSVDLAVHYVEGTPQAGKYAYDVSVYFSAYKAGGEPYRDLQIGDLSITEEGRRVDITGLELAEQEPISVVVVMDTSGSMRGAKMDGARNAAASFISGLGSDDLAAVISFNSTVRTEIGFTDDLGDAREKIELLNAVEGAGTCLYDAINEAITLGATLPSGRRAIVVLTDGIDELPNGNPCSKYREEDVTNLARGGNTRVPIYTIGLGSRVDATGLARIADSTGGRYQFASDELKLQDLFQNLLEQLRSQYRASYVSTAAPGPHQIVLEATLSGQTVREIRDFVLPNFPYSLNLVSPAEGQPLSLPLSFVVQVIGQGDPIQQVDFFVNEQKVGSTATTPYEFSWQPAEGEPVPSGEVQIDVVAVGTSGQELARVTRLASFAGQESSTASSSESGPLTLPGDENTGLFAGISATTLMIGGGVGLVILAAVVAVVVLSIRRKQKEAERDRLWAEKVQGVGQSDPTFSGGMEDRTYDSFTPSSDALGVLVVLQSDDPAMVGQRFEITRHSTSLGRKADNDLIFAKDSPVSRHHATIDERGGGLFLSEVWATDDGSAKRPAYGTFVNDLQIEDSVRLKNGDQIRLGKRLRLRFEGIGGESMDDHTIDQFGRDDDEKTMDNLGA